MNIARVIPKSGNRFSEQITRKNAMFIGTGEGERAQSKQPKETLRNPGQAMTGSRVPFSSRRATIQ
jgi:hypothetical protein